LSGPCYVYCLFDPMRRKPFYIGIASNPWNRFDGHRHDCGSAAWRILNQLLEAGYQRQMILKIYKKCPDRQAALDLEYSLVTSTKGLLNRSRVHQRMFV
jgi:predicted GIY-YIG superfamily endonuclease